MSKSGHDGPEFWVCEVRGMAAEKMRDWPPHLSGAFVASDEEIAELRRRGVPVFKTLGPYPSASAAEEAYEQEDASWEFSSTIREREEAKDREDGVRLERERSQALDESCDARVAQGDPDALFALAIQDEHRGDLERAATRYRQVAELGRPAAQLKLGWLYYEGRGVPRDMMEAARWWRQAAEGRFEVAGRRLGQLYVDGLIVPQDDVEAHRSGSRPTTQSRRGSSWTNARKWRLRRRRKHPPHPPSIARISLPSRRRLGKWSRELPTWSRARGGGPR
jgi:hypothetical protein